LVSHPAWKEINWYRIVQKVSWLLFNGFTLTRYCNIKGIAIAGSMFPTITTVKVDGSLKHVLKNSQAFRGSTFCRSLFLIGCKTKNMLKVKSRSFSQWFNY